MTSPRPALPPARIPAAHWLAGALVALFLHAGLLLALGPGLGDLRSPPTLALGAGGAGMRISLEGQLGDPGDAPGAATPRRVASPAPPHAKPQPRPARPAPVHAPARVREPLPPARHTASLESTAAAVSPATAPVTPGAAEVAAAVASDDSSGTDVAAGPPAAIRGGAGGSGAPGDGASGAGPAGDAYFDAVFARVVSALEYPRRARLERIEGTVVLRLRLDRAGRIDRMEVAESSGSSLLDRQALRIVRRAAPFGPVPASLDDRSLAFELPLQFVLTDGGAGG